MFSFELSKREFSIRAKLMLYIACTLLLFILFMVFTSTEVYQQSVRANTSELMAKLSVGVLNLLGWGATQEGNQILFGRQGLSIAQGCDAVAPILLIICCISLYPLAKRNEKLKGIFYCTTLLILINLIRIFSLIFIVRYLPGAFDFFHVEFWQTVFILIAGAAFLVWLYFLDSATESEFLQNTI